MKNIFTAAILPLLAGLAISCNSTTALQTTESDDLYYASTDRTYRPEAPYATSESVSATEEVLNPEYAAAGSNQNNITNNYNYYDSDRYYSRSYTSSRFRNYSYYSADPFYDPFYSPFGYSAAYCYNLYDPFWYPYCYPSGGLSVTISYGYGYPGYGAYYGYRPYGYGYRPYDYYGYGYGYGGGYGGYYQGFYDGYYAGGGGYGYGYHRSRVNYGPRTNRSNVPGRAPANSVTGRPASPGREAQPDQYGGTMVPGGRPNRISQTGGTAPGQAGKPVNGSSPQNGREQTSGRPVQPSRPQREGQAVQPENYQFQQHDQPAIQYSRPVREQVETPSRPDRAPVQDVRPVTPNVAPVQTEQPSRRQRSRSQAQLNNQPSQQRSAPVYENSRPSRSNDNGGSYQTPSRSSSGMERSGGGGRPRR